MPHLSSSSRRIIGDQDRWQRWSSDEDGPVNNCLQLTSNNKQWPGCCCWPLPSTGEFNEHMTESNTDTKLDRLIIYCKKHVCMDIDILKLGKLIHWNIMCSLFCIFVVLHYDVALTLDSGELHQCTVDCGAQYWLLLHLHWLCHATGEYLILYTTCIYSAILL